MGSSTCLSPSYRSYSSYESYRSYRRTPRTREPRGTSSVHVPAIHSHFRQRSLHVQTTRERHPRILRAVRLRGGEAQSGSAARGGEGESPQADRQLQPGTRRARGAVRTADDAGPQARRRRARTAREGRGEPPGRQSRSRGELRVAPPDRTARAHRESHAARAGRDDVQGTDPRTRRLDQGRTGEDRSAPHLARRSQDQEGDGRAHRNGLRDDHLDRRFGRYARPAAQDGRRRARARRRPRARRTRHAEHGRLRDAGSRAEGTRRTGSRRLRRA